LGALSLRGALSRRERDTTKKESMMTDANGPVEGFDETNGLAGDLEGDDDNTVEAHRKKSGGVGSLFTDAVQRGATTVHDFDSDDEDEQDPEGSDGEEPI
jgi:hypothetical protein